MRFTDVHKVYQWRGQRRRGETLKGALFQRGRVRRASMEAHKALDGVSLDVEPGEAIAQLTMHQDPIVNAHQKPMDASMSLPRADIKRIDSAIEV